LVVNGIPTIAAPGWNALRSIARSARPLRGTNVRLHWTTDGVHIAAGASTEFKHPWQLTPRWRPDPETPSGGEWVAKVEPGFVNGLDATVEGVPLTDAPEIAFTAFRDPAASAGIAATNSGDLVQAPGEGYPRFFETLGVKPAAKGGKLGDQPPVNPSRTREIRACDVVLISPRMSSRQRVDLLSPIGDQQTVQISTAFSTAALRANPQHRLVTQARWTPPAIPTALERLLGLYAEQESDELLICTAYFVSPPDAGADAIPDRTWSVWPQYRVFWNLAHASRADVNTRPFQPIRFFLPLAGGIAQPIVDSILSPINDALAAVHELLNATDFAGIHWAPGGLGLDRVNRPQPTARRKPTGFDPAAQKKSRAAAAEPIPPLNPPFPFSRTRFEPGFFRLQNEPPPE
jgi:hypothetical protein